jgi:hypothetical protein
MRAAHGSTARRVHLDRLLDFPAIRCGQVHQLVVAEIHI